MNKKKNISEGIASQGLRERISDDFDRILIRFGQMKNAISSNPEFSKETKAELMDHIDAIRSEINVHFQEFSDLFDSSEEYYDKYGYEGLNEVRKLVREVITETFKDDKKKLPLKTKLKLKLKGISDAQLEYNMKHGLPHDWEGSVEGYWESAEGRKHYHGSN